jgi:hypothetical protein
MNKVATGRLCFLSQITFFCFVLVEQLCAQAANAASTPTATNATRTSGAKGPKTDNPAPKLTPEQERGLRLLKAAEAEAAGLQADMHAFVLWGASNAYVKLDPKKAERLRLEAFTATQSIETSASDDTCAPVGSAGDIKSWIQTRVLSDLVRENKAEQAQELLPNATTPVQRDLTSQLVKYYADKKEPAQAMGLLSALSETEQYPFNAAADLLIAFGRDHSADQMNIFVQTVANFQQHPSGGFLGQDDIGSFLEKTWQQVPPAMALDAFDKILDQAKSNDSPQHMSVTNDKGSVNLNLYQLRLFQLMPMIAVLDKDRAEKLLRENAELQAQLSKYPKGMNSLMAGGNSFLSMSIGSDTGGGPPPEATAAMQLSAQIAKQVNEIRHLAENDPTQAISRALNLPMESPQHFSSPRADALLAIAQANWNKKPAPAKSALDEITKFEEQLNPQEMQTLAEVPELYFKMGEADSAKKSLSPMLKSAERLYTQDTNADDPNKAFKGTWPSSNLWRKCVQAAAKISQALAEEIISQIPDPEIAGALRISFASALLGISADPTIVSSCHKNGSMFNFSD